jgi:glycine/D-amino acid oxidase-like deaminating enzyme
MSQSQPDRGSLWLDRPGIAAGAPLPEDGSYDDIVVGAGLTGLVVALLLARAGRRVGVVEARRAGAVTTGHTTAKVSLLQGTTLSRLLRRQSRDVAAAYVDANREGQAWLLRFCADHDVAHQRRDAVTFAAASDELPAARAEHDAAASLGLPVRWTRDLDVPFPLEGATVLADQAQFDPMDVVEALVAELGRHGGALHEGHRVIGVSKLGSPVVRLADGHELRASNVVLATGTPVLDRGLYFAKLEPQRSYILAFDSVIPPQGMFLSAGQPVVSVREVPRDGSSLLLVGGSGHVVGRARSEQEHVNELRDWTARYFPGARETHSWSAQDYTPPDGIPYVGRMPRGAGHIFVATGYAKWGMTNAVAAALNITGEILGQPPSWAVPLRHRIPGPRGAARVVGFNVGVVEAALRSLPRVPSTLTASDQVLPVCTHLGGCLHWNDAEGTWDCPLHGSRFAADGEVLEGPATRPLRPRG